MNDSPNGKCVIKSGFRLCSCVFDRYGNKPLEKAISMHERQLIPIGWRLDYTTLEEETGRRFCSMSFCTQCNSLYCEGDGLPDDLADGKLLSLLYELLYSKAKYRGIPNQGDARALFGAEFLRLFHEADKPIVSDWLNLQPNKVIQTFFPNQTN